MSARAPMEHLARDEVVALHEFFVEWFRDTGGAAPDFALCERAFAPDFRMVTPNGEVHDLATVVARLRAMRGAMTTEFHIRILDPRAVWVAEDAALLEYVEDQYRDGRSTRRRSTAFFTRNPLAPRGVDWRHLQETWMDTD